MPTYTGTLTGSGEFVGTGILSGVTEDVSQSDDVTAELVLNSNGTFTGTEDQVFPTTVTINFPGESPSTTTSTYDTGAKPVSGNVNTPYVTTITENGNTITTTWIFSSDHSTINVTATDVYSSTGISGGYDLGGTLSAPPIIISSTSAQGINGESGTSNYVEFIVTLSQAQTVPVTVHYATQDDTAQANVNYVPVSGTLTFAAGKTTAVVDVHTIGTTDMVGNTDFDLVLSSPTNAELPGNVTSQPYTGTIIDINTLGPTPSSLPTAAQWTQDTADQDPGNYFSVSSPTSTEDTTDTWRDGLNDAIATGLTGFLKAMVKEAKKQFYDWIRQKADALGLASEYSVAKTLFTEYYDSNKLQTLTKIFTNFISNQFSNMENAIDGSVSPVKFATNVNGNTQQFVDQFDQYAQKKLPAVNNVVTNPALTGASYELEAGA
jgi:hypothetical protein